MMSLDKISTLLNDPQIIICEQVQSLWSGYGQIVRVFSQCSGQSYIVKVVMPNQAGEHPRGWNTSTSHQRKLRSYQVEAVFYQHYAQLADEHCRVPKLIASQDYQEGIVLVMEDLDDAGFSVRKGRATWQELKMCIRWLAYFHGRFMGTDAANLWPVGTYWHLATRQDEWQAMPDSDVKQQAEAIDIALNSAQFQTLVHGDAKLANLCFHANKQQVAAVDFQYVGRGVGVKDLAYLAGSAFDDQGLYQYGELILNEYICQLSRALQYYQKPIDHNAIEAEYRELYPLAWADFYRFLLGWNPKSWKICGYMQEMTEKGLHSQGEFRRV